MKKYQKLHDSIKVAEKHIAKIKKGGGIIDEELIQRDLWTNEILSVFIKYHFPDIKQLKLLNEIVVYIERNGYSVNKDNLKDGFISVKDRVSPNINKGEKYNDMVEKIKTLAQKIKDKYKIKLKYNYFEEWFGFTITE